jgi:hypothetical protein
MDSQEPTGKWRGGTRQKLWAWGGAVVAGLISTLTGYVLTQRVDLYGVGIAIGWLGGYYVLKRTQAYKRKG